jgi:zinc transport system ATP-binding protein
MTTVIEFKNVTVKYGNLVALDEINLSIPEYEFLGIIGPNGGGKTTFLKILTGLIKPTKGEIKIYGKEINKMRSILGYVPQFTSFDNTYPISVYDVVKMGRLGKHSPDDGDIICDSLNTLNIYNLRHDLIGNLSGGQKQRVLIARALASKPKIILLDEPTASIDAKTGQSIYELLHQLNEKATIILVSHDIGAISSYVKKIACLNKKLIYHDTKEISRETLETTYQCPVDLIAHGLPHRVLEKHNH